MLNVITVTVLRDHKGNVAEFTISGHAGFADLGEDIVCAGVSAVSFGTVNAIGELLKIRLAIEMEEESGFLHCVIPDIPNRDTHEKVQLLLAAMLLTLESIASQYGEHVTIKQVKRR